MIVIDGRKEALKIKNRLKKEIAILKEEGVNISLSVILVGNDPASKIYVKNKKKACDEIGINSKEIFMDENVSEKELVKKIEDLNKDKTVNGILIQLPLPKNFNEYEIICKIAPLKDVDCFHYSNIGMAFLGKHNFLPCTPAGILSLIDSTGFNVSGKNCTIIGRSNIVGKPICFLMLKRNATVTVCHSKTKNLSNYTKNADILIVAVGSPNIIRGNMIKKGAVVIDVGINRLFDGKLVGDVCFEEAKDVAGFITPVPGGVGPMTIAKLLENTVKAAKLQNKI